VDLLDLSQSGGSTRGFCQGGDESYCLSECVCVSELACGISHASISEGDNVLRNASLGGLVVARTSWSVLTLI
jgi:hypothetical protein